MILPEQLYLSLHCQKVATMFPTAAGSAAASQLFPAVKTFACVMITFFLD